MNKLFTIFILLIFVAISFGQNQQKEMVTVPKDMLTADQKAKLEVKQQVESVKEWGGIGKEIGEGAKAIFEALNKNAVEFGESTPGMALIGILAWNIIGTDFIQFIFGIPLWIIGTILFVHSFRRTCVPRHIVTSKKLVKEGRVFNKYDKTYEIVNDEDDKKYERLTHAFMYILFIAVCSIVIFA